MKKFIFRLFVVLSLFAVSLFAEEKNPNPLVMGTASGYAPFVSLNEKGEYEGFDIDIANALAKKLNRPLEIKDYGTMPSLMLALKQKKVDAIIWAISMTEKRKASLEMIHYQGEKEETIPLVFWGETPENVRSLSDLVGNDTRPICIEAGSYQEDVVKTCPNIPLKYFDSVQDVILDLKYGKSRASALDPALLPRFLEKYPEIKVLSLPLPNEMQSEGNGICVRKDSKKLAREVKNAVEELKSEGTISQMEKKWGLIDGA